MHFRRATLLSTLLVAWGGLGAQTAECADQLDDRASESAYMAVLGTAHFQATRMNMPATLVTMGSYDDFWDKSMQAMINSYNHSGEPTAGGNPDWNTVQRFVSDLTGDTGFAASIEAFMIGNAFAGLISTLQSFNIGHREYTFLVPAAGPYTIVAHLTGGIDKPRNRVVLSTPSGNVQLDDDNPSSDRDKSYTVNLQPGIYGLSMQLGSGSSALFHNAGTLTSVTLSSPTPVSWTSEIIVTCGKTNIVTTMPEPGSVYTTNLPYVVPVASDFPNVLSGTVWVDNIRPLPVVRQPNFVVTWNSEDPYILCVTLCTLAFDAQPTVGPSFATYSFRRGPDLVKTYGVHPGIRHPTLEP